MRFFPACIAALSLALAACDSHNQPQKTAASSQSAPVESTSTSASGTIAVWVPAGIIGSDYWIYLNRRIVNAPPHSTDNNISPRNFVLVAMPNGFEIFDDRGQQLRAVNDNWDMDIGYYVSTHPKDLPHIFQEVDLTVQPGSYTLDAAYLSNTADEFPFVFTHGQTISVTAGQTTKVYLAIPNGWENLRGIAARAACGVAPVAPDFAELKSRVDGYMTDPLVKAVRNASAESRTTSIHTVTLNLPPEQGGQREFDGSELSHIVDGIKSEHSLQSEKDLADCQAQYPDYASSYAAYRQTIAVIDNDMAALRRFADGLGKD